MRALQAMELAIRRLADHFEHSPVGPGNFSENRVCTKLLRATADNIKEAAAQADEADGTKQALFLDELDTLRRAQS